MPENSHTNPRKKQGGRQIEDKSVWFDCPYFADVFEGCEALEGLQSSPIVICVDEVVEVGGELGMAVVMVSLDSRLFDRPVHPLDLPIGPGELYLELEPPGWVRYSIHFKKVDRC